MRRPDALLRRVPPAAGAPLAAAEPLPPEYADADGLEADELEAPEPYVDTSLHGQYLPARKVLYLIDERTAADSEPMVIE